jgi:hypothetical protein
MHRINSWGRWILAALLLLMGGQAAWAAGFSVSGNAGVAGAAVTVGSQSVVSDSKGAYSITGLAAGAYTVVPSKPEYVFTPVSVSVTVGPNAAAKNFKAAVLTYTISGNAGVAKATVTAGGKTATTNASGAFTIAGLVGGSYAVAPSKAGFSFSPASLPATVGPSVGGMTFKATAIFSISGNAGVAGATVTAGGQTVTSNAKGAYSFTGLLAGTYTVTPSKLEHTFAPASIPVTVGPNAAAKNFKATELTYTVSGNAGVAKAVVSAGGKTATSDAAGAYTIKGVLAGTHAVTPSKNGYSFAPPFTSLTIGPSVTGTDFAATAIFTISGKVGVAGATVTAGGQTITSDAKGAYSFTGLLAGPYTVTPSKAEFSFTPASLAVTVGPNAANKNFKAAVVTYTISGNAGSDKVTLKAGGKSATSSATGAYTITGVTAGTYLVSPSKTGFRFSPADISVAVGPSVSGRDFAATAVFTIAGNAGVAGATVTAGEKSATSNSTGAYTISGLTAGTYTVSPSKPEYTFTPPSVAVTVGPNAAGKSFKAALNTYTVSGNAGTAGVTVTAGTKTATSDASGNYTLTSLLAGSYSVTPAKNGFSFEPVSTSVTVGPSSAGKNFTATIVYYTISGNTSVPGVTVTAGGKSVVSDAQNNYTITGLTAGNYSVTAQKAGCTFEPAPWKVAVGPSQANISFTTPCLLHFPKGQSSFADGYIRNYPYTSSSGQRWQDLTTVNSKDNSGSPCSPHLETCLNAPPYNLLYPVYSTGYAGGQMGNCDPAFGWCNSWDRSYNSVSRPHPRPNIGRGISIWMNGLSGNDTAGYDFTAVGGGYHELADQIIVMDPLGSCVRNTTCQKSPPYDRSYWECSDLFVYTNEWGPDARKVYPGEITPNYWGIVPIDDTTDRWQTLVAHKAELAGGATTVPTKKGNGYVFVQYSYPAPRPVLDGVFGGGSGPQCIAGATRCFTVFDSDGSIGRSKIQLVNGEWFVTITGYMTTSDSVLRNTLDVESNLATLSGSGTVHDGLYQTIMAMNELGIAGSAHLIGHSLGAMDVVTLYSLGYGQSAVGYAVPFMTPYAAMLPQYSPINGLRPANRPIYSVSGMNDPITNMPSSPCGPATNTHGCRVGWGVNDILIDTGGGFASLNNPHDRTQYQLLVGAAMW